MTFESRLRLSLLLLKIKAGMLSIVPLMAYGADQTVQNVGRAGSIEAVSTLQWAFLFGFSMMGWAVSELDKLAELWNVDGKSPYEVWRERLKLLKGIAAACAAGMLIYFLGQAAPGVFLRMIGIDSANAQGVTTQFPDMVLFVFVSGGGYMGARWFAWLERKFFGGAS